ncbi:hypothetical protein SEUCBS139899_000031 [Sporothrix eucalyptigena]|uniref:D-serine dehydratase-like domain-containing protein n=1 Tax=Sporothrix eucalyptigena TaxID=1812306 RepID=A0ABP0AR86_9PEZI
MDPRSLIGKRLGDHAIPIPAAVLDRAIVQRNCSNMLSAIQTMHLGWRAHIKTHKTIELTRLQVGDELPVQLIASTVLEAERVLPLLQSYQEDGRSVNILYGFPLYPSAVPRLAELARKLGSGCVSILIDHSDQVPVVQQLAQESGAAINAFVKVDMGSHRAGVVPGSPQFTAVIQKVLAAHVSKDTNLSFYGLYCHAGHSYEAREPWAAMAHLVSEFTALGDAARAVRDITKEMPTTEAVALPLVLSVGASPTAATLQHPDLGGAGGPEAADGSAGATQNAATLRTKLTDLASQGYTLEVHAGVQPVLDLQQLATHSWGGGNAQAGRAETDDLALTIVADVATIYPGRGTQGGDEILVNVGCLALGREPVKDVPIASGTGPTYAGWGIVRPWTKDDSLVSPGPDFPRLPPADGKQGWWQVGRISQEHGILTWAGGPVPSSASSTPQLGQRLRIWPNHACIAGAGFSYYLITDSTGEDPDLIVDIWERWNGW